MVKMLGTMGMTLATIRTVGIVELLCIVLFAIPRTGVLGAMLLSAYVGGAIATHLEHSLPVTMPVIIECVVFITAVIRFPELLRRLTGKVVLANFSHRTTTSRTHTKTVG